jgi:hypothetical protein
VKALEQGLEGEPLGHEADLRRHGGEAHRGKERADAEDEAALAQPTALGEAVAAARREHPIGADEHPALGERVAREVQHGYRPGEPRESVEPIGSEEETRAEARDRDCGVLRGRERQQPAPVILLECVEHGQDRGDDPHGRDHDPKAEDTGARCEPGHQGPGEAEESGVEDDTRQDGAGCAARIAISARKPFIEGQEAEFGAEAEEREQPHRDPRPGRHRVCGGCIGTEGHAHSGILREQEKGEQDADDPRLEEREHVERAAAGSHRGAFREDHHRAADAHELPGDEERVRVLQPKHPQRADEREGGAGEPRGPRPPARTRCGRRSSSRRSAWMRAGGLGGQPGR